MCAGGVAMVVREWTHGERNAPPERAVHTQVAHDRRRHTRGARPPR